MKWGYFDSANHEYVITRPDTPRVWSNYIGSRTYGGVVTSSGGGYSFTRSPAAGRILRHRYNAVPADLPGRQFYIRDCATGEFWSTAWQATQKPLDQYKTETRFGPGYVSINSRYCDIETTTKYFVPLGEQFEYWHLRITNHSATARTLRAFAFCEFTTEWNMMNDLLNLQYSQYIAQGECADGIISASANRNLPSDPDNFANRDQSRFWWMAQGCETPSSGFDCDRDTFMGTYGDFRTPAAVAAGQCSNSVGYSDNICGALQSDLTLAPSESADIVILVGIGEGKTVGRTTREKFGSAATANSELARVKAYWHELLDCFRTETPDQAFNDMVNTWGAYNALMTFEWSRACSLVYTGDNRDGFGYRDTVQDCLGVTSIMPAEVRERIILMLSGQDSTGGAQPEVRPWLHKPGQMKPTHPGEYRSDDCLWFFNVIPTYVAESGDSAFYDTRVPYADSGEATVLGHLRRALEFNIERSGANGLPCGLLADWNDCLKLGYKGESLFVAFQLRLGLATYASVATDKGLATEAAWATSELQKLDAAIAKIAWDGEWFRWAIAENGTIFGSKNYPEGQVYMNTQAWSIISGAATPEQTKLSMQAVADRLASPWGVAICAPPFERTPVAVMRAVLMNPGNKENGGIFSHIQSWIVIAEILAGNAERAYQYYRAFMPSAQNDKAETREIEPFVHCQSTHSQFSKKFGKSRVPWLSGTASWAHYTATNYILGIQPCEKGLRLAPAIPAAWPSFRVSRKFRGMTLDIEVRNPSAKNSGVTALTINGEAIEGNFIPLDKLCNGAKIIATM